MNAQTPGDQGLNRPCSLTIDKRSTPKTSARDTIVTQASRWQRGYPLAASSGCFPDLSPATSWKTKKNWLSLGPISVAPGLTCASHQPATRYLLLITGFTTHTVRSLGAVSQYLTSCKLLACLVLFSRIYNVITSIPQTWLPQPCLIWPKFPSPSGLLHIPSLHHHFPYLLHFANSDRLFIATRSTPTCSAS